MRNNVKTLTKASAKSMNIAWKVNPSLRSLSKLFIIQDMPAIHDLAGRKPRRMVKVSLLFLKLAGMNRFMAGSETFLKPCQSYGHIITCLIRSLLVKIGMTTRMFRETGLNINQKIVGKYWLTSFHNAKGTSLGTRHADLCTLILLNNFFKFPLAKVYVDKWFGNWGEGMKG